jgi:5-methylcytosine-specific restriction endonuclease McrA
VARTSRPASRPAIVATSASANGSRHVPAALKRAVWARDQGRCTFHGSKGRCAETGHLEFHHIVPFAVGGKTDIENLTLRCRAHNRFESDEHFGRTSNF